MEPVTRKEVLLARVRAALRRHGGAGPPDGAAARVPPEPAGGPERISLFRNRFEAIGGTFLEGASPEAVLPALAQALRAEGVTSLLFPRGDDAARILGETLAIVGPFRIVSPDELRRPLLPVTAGIQTAEFAIAETGTIVQTSRGGKTLLPGLLTDIHVAILFPGIFHAAMEECLEALSADPPRNISCITGPSRTADIELTLTIGVHGPRGVIAVLTSPSPG